MSASTENPFAGSPFEIKKVRRENSAKTIMLGAAILLIVPVLVIVGYLFYKASPVLSWDYIWSDPGPLGKSGGIWLPLIGTFYLVIVSLLLVAPIGILAGVYLNEYAPNNWFTRVINMAVTSLAGVPSIVHALFGVGAFVLTLKMGESLIAAACTIAVMTIPVIVTATREALASVPMSFREACWNMGATKWQTIRTIVLPNSISGILTGVILEISRAAGETAPILFTGATAAVAINTTDIGYKLMPYDLDDRFMALSYHLHVVAEKISGMPEEMKYGTAAVLIALIVVINSFSISLRLYLRTRKKW
ncbi:MAG: phosphate ABC transporter permease PstA [Verrucomicrobiales bacterium]|jgi:phosphate transport system permease protein|nr:phosphate ABC transporter permease PstA [Verrucomicrobiales bacterium]